MKLYNLFKNILSSLSKLNNIKLNCPPQQWMQAQVAQRLGSFSNTYVKDYVVSRGSIGTYGGWRKWNSGRAEYWDDINMSSAVTLSYGSMRFVDQTISYPSDLFIEAPSVNIQSERGTGLYYVSVHLNNATTISFYLASDGARSSSESTWYHLTAKGKWK